MDTFTRLNPYFNAKEVNCSAISKKTKIPVRTVQRYYKKFKAQIPLSELRKPGRPLKFPKNLNRKMGKIVKENNSLTAKRIQNILNRDLEVKISTRTVSRRLNQIGLRKFKPRFIPKITPSQEKQRVLFAKNNQKTDWENVVFSDESAFQLDHNAHTVWAESQASAIVPKCKYSKKVMIWGAFSAKGKSKLFFVEKTLKSDGYQALIKSHLLPFTRKNHKNNSFIFQQDNAPCHVSRSLKNFFAQKRIELLPWPSNSAD